MTFPKGFIESLDQHPGFDEAAFTAQHQNPETVVSIRQNPYKKGPLPNENNQKIDWCKNGFYLSNRPIFTLEPSFHAGAYYVQEASSMFLGHILTQIQTTKDKAWRVLDLCAAPGGKSTLISSFLANDDLLLANEIIKIRVPILCDNLSKWGEANVCVSNNDPRDFERLGAFFDLIVVDAPCSSSGMFRKAPETMQEWTPENVQLCAGRQERILHDIYPTLHQDGYLIYSTCSYSKNENEDIVDKICDAYAMESVRIPLQNTWGIVESTSTRHKAYGYRFYPDKAKGEGFFVACLRKKQEETNLTKSPKIDFKKVLAPEKDISLFKPYLQAPEAFEYLQTPDGICAVWKNQLRDILHLQRNLYLKKSGVKLGKVAGKDVIPDHELAVSNIIHTDVPRAHLTVEESLRYLRKEDISLHDSLKGWLLICHQNLALGWAKNLGNRVNNYYPKALRILMREG